MSLRTLYFIGHCLSLDDHPSFRETIIVQFSDPDYDWNTFIFTCSNHLVLPVIYLKFRKHNLLSYLPEVLVQHLEEIYSLNRDRNLQIIEQMKEITVTLNSAGISPLFMKGTGNLIDGVYSDVGERIIGDIDLLVPEKDFLTAAGLFEKEGYQICYPVDENTKSVKHYPRLWKENEVADLEIHRLPTDLKHATNFTAEVVLKTKKSVAGYPGCYVLADEHKVILNFIHSQLANAGHILGIVSLRDIYDLYCFSKRVKLQNITKTAPFRQKMIAYLKISEKLLMLPDSFYAGETIGSRAYQLKHDLNSTSVLISTANRLNWVISLSFGFVIRQIRDIFTNPAFRRKNILNLLSPAFIWNKFRLSLKLAKGSK